MTCFAAEALASTVAGLPGTILAAPLSPEMKMGEHLLHHIATATPTLSHMEAVFCSGESTQSNNNNNNNVASTAAAIHQSMVAAAAAAHSGSGFYDNLLDDEDQTVDRAHCQDMLETLTLEAAVDTMLLTMADEYITTHSGDGDDYTTTNRNCLHAAVYFLARRPEICFLWASPAVALLNTVASGIVQSGGGAAASDGGGGDDDVTPFYSAGIDGRGQVVALSDTGLDVDNCYFWDAQRQVAKERSDNFDRDVRKVVQYHSFADDAAVSNSHGTHVAGTIAGRRAVAGTTESNGSADGVARGAQLAFFDIGNRTFVLIRCGCRSCV